METGSPDVTPDTNGWTMRVVRHRKIDCTEAMRQKLIGAETRGHGCTKVRMIKGNLMGAALSEGKGFRPMQKKERRKVVSKQNKQSISFLQKSRTKQNDGLQDRDRTGWRAERGENGKSVGKK